MHYFQVEDVEPEKTTYLRPKAKLFWSTEGVGWVFEPDIPNSGMTITKRTAITGFAFDGST